MDTLYYIAPDHEKFEELKYACIRLWEEQYEGAYSREKVGRIRDLPNVSDNFMYMVAMFDPDNQRKLAHMLSMETRKAIRDRLIAGGGTLIVF